MDSPSPDSYLTMYSSSYRKPKSNTESEEVKETKGRIENGME